MVASGKSQRSRSEKVILLGPDEYQSSRHPGDFGNLPKDSNNEDRLQTRIETIRIHKYLRKAATTALNALQQLSLPH